MTTTPRGRATHLSPDAHRLYQALIDHTIASGAAPTTAALARSTGFAEGRVADALAEIVERERAGRDADGLSWLKSTAVRMSAIPAAGALARRPGVGTQG